MTLNKVQLIGRLGKDPEVRRLNGGDRVVNFSLATSERWRNKDGERQEKTEWHSIVIFNEKLGEIAEQYLRKGKEVYIEGKLQTRKWEDKEGVTKYTTEIVIQKFNGDIKLLGSKDDDDTRESRSRDDYAERKSTGKPQPETASSRKKPSYDDLDDDIPF